MKQHKELWKFIKFNIGVLISSAVDILVYMFLLHVVFVNLQEQPIESNALFDLLGIRYKGYLYAYFISTTLGYIVAYLINRYITFKSNINAAYSSILYALLAIFNILISSVLGSIWGTYMLEHNLSGVFVEMLSKFIIINIPTIWTYPIERYVIQIRKGKS